MKATSLKTAAILAGSIALLAGNATAQATTGVVGYETNTLAPGQFNLIGVRLFNAEVTSGTFDSSTATTLGDSGQAFALTAGTDYIIEFSNGASITLLGSNFAGTTVSGLTGIDASFETDYVVREAETVSTVFGAANEAGIAGSATADPTTADIIFLPDGAGFKRIFFSTYAAPYDGWLNADTFAKVPDEVIDPSQGMFVQTAVSVAPIDLVVTGDLKTTPTAYAVPNAFTLLGSMYPAGATLTTADLSTYMQGSATADPTTADVALLPNGAGGFVRAFFSTYAAPYDGWLNADTFAKIPDQPLPSGFFIQRTGPAFSGINTPPAFYAGL